MYPSGSLHRTMTINTQLLKDPEACLLLNWSPLASKQERTFLSCNNRSELQGQSFVQQHIMAYPIVLPGNQHFTYKCTITK